MKSIRDGSLFSKSKLPRLANLAATDSSLEHGHAGYTSYQAVA